ncbi:sigma-70 family RNA polymerase sigma factor [Calycomorphotria hydatis]|uniref:sigma-70 family RNA polymerase sigma factor n=1 Tax=Calycomorphotria hydatis TaxID=2528027 RepID=UPI0018D20B27|nr:sigma-70 family RNA polymerase sigma factor [Calycomorphotria hydatis]
MSLSEPRSEQRKEEFLELFNDSRRELRAYVGVLIMSVVDADDTFQELSYVLWKRFDEFERGGSFLAWGRGIAFNLAREYWRKRGSRKVVNLMPKALQALSRAHRGQSELLEMRRELLKACIDQLPRTDRRLVSGVYESGLPLKALAAKFEVSVGAIYTRLSRLRDRLRHCVEEKCND